MQLRNSSRHCEPFSQTREQLQILTMTDKYETGTSDGSGSDSTDAL